jgi:hypothetical protein
LLTGALYSEYHARVAAVVAKITCVHEYMPCAPSGFQITVIQVDRPAITAIARRLCANAATTASGHV